MIIQYIKRIKRECNKAILVAVTKNRSISDIIEVVKCGVKFIAENRIQEAESKYIILKDFLKLNNVSFHFIGHLQSNKAKKAVEMFDVIQSVDSLRLAKIINKRASELNKIQEIFLQINIGKEKQKYGLSPEQVFKAIDEIKGLSNLNLTGLMCIPPYSKNPEDSRIYFREMKVIFDKINSLKYLSMGMTNDYKVAVEEGSNMIRIGRWIFEG